MTIAESARDGGAPATGAASRVRWAIADGASMTRRSLMHWVANPTPVIVGLLFPIMIVLMFGYLFGGAISVPGGGDYREFLMPGIFGLTMVFGLEATMIAVTTDAARGITDRFRSMPMAPSAVVVGRSAADMLSSALGLVVLIGCGLLVGWQARGGVVDALGAIGLLLLLRFSLLWVGIYLGLISKTPETVTAVQILVWPLAFASNAFVAPETMPAWLATVTEWNPLSSTIAACRELFGNPGWGGDSWIAQHAVPMAIIWPTVIIGVFLPLAVRRYQKLSR